MIVWRSRGAADDGKEALILGGAGFTVGGELGEGWWFKSLMGRELGDMCRGQARVSTRFAWDTRACPLPVYSGGKLRG